MKHNTWMCLHRMLYVEYNTNQQMCQLHFR